MTRPSLFVRVAGSPRKALLLLVCCAAVVVGWCGGDVVWWVGLAAVGVSIRTLSAIGQLRRYKAWLAEWNAMGDKEEPSPPPKKKRAGRGTFIGIAVLLLFVVPAWSQHIEGNDGFRTALMLLWFVSLIYLVGAALRGITRRMRRRPQVQVEADAAPESATAPVQWMLGRASSSPSRAESARQLPEYCTRLLSAGSGARSEK